MMKVIQAIENELAEKYLPGARDYVDKHYDGAWSKAIDTLDAALTKALQMNNYESLEIEGEIYKQTIIYLIGIYKEHKRDSKINEFLNSLGG